MNKNVIAFDIETIPCAASLRQTYPWKEIQESFDPENDLELTEAVRQDSIAKTGKDFLPLHLHKIVAISCFMSYGENKIHVGSLGSETDDEATLLQKFFKLVRDYTPQLVNWNGTGFDLPVMNYRAMIHGVVADRYWDMGEGNFADSRDFKWNNYINRYHTRHCDLMDVLAMHQPKAVGMDQMAKLCGFPGKLDMDGGMVWQTYYEQGIKPIRDYCETDTANTYLLYLRFQLINGSLSREEYDSETAKVRHFLEEKAAKENHWREFCDAWNAA